MRYSVNERSSAYPTHLSWICATIYYIRSAYLLVMRNIERPNNNKQVCRKLNRVGEF